MKKALALLLCAAFVLALLAGCAPEQPKEKPPLPVLKDQFGNSAVGYDAAVVCADPASAQAGLEIMKAGGNAVDAAVAVAFCVGVTEPAMSGIGGSGIMNLYLAEARKCTSLEYMETLPAAITPGWYSSADSRTAKNAAVPSAVMGLLTALEQYGTKSRQEVMAPAIRLAREGFAVSARLSQLISANLKYFSEEAKAVYTRDGAPWQEGEIMTNPALADTLQAIADGGIEAFYKGALAEKMTADLQKAGSLMAMSDLAAYTAAERDTISTSYHGYEVVTVSAPAQGGYWLLEALNLMELVQPEQYEFNSPEYLFLFNECSRLAREDAYTFLGDPAFVSLPIDQLISKEYAARRAALIDTEAPLRVRFGFPKSDLTVEESKHTTHIVVTDPQGNTVSMTNTLGNHWGCKFYAPGLGFFYNSHVSNMNHKDPASPDYIAPGKRVRTTIAPTIVLKEGKPWMALGSPGSLAIPPAVAATLNNVILYGMELQEAINQPRALGTTRAEGKSHQLSIENDLFSAELLQELKVMGYTFDQLGGMDPTVGGIAALIREGDFVIAAGDPRRQFASAAY